MGSTRLNEFWSFASSANPDVVSHPHVTASQVAWTLLRVVRKGANRRSLHDTRNALSPEEPQFLLATRLYD